MSLTWFTNMEKYTFMILIFFRERNTFLIWKFTLFLVAGSNVSAYINMVCDTLRNTIPKAVVYCQVREAKRSLLNHFYVQVGKKEVWYDIFWLIFTHTRHSSSIKQSLRGQEKNFTYVGLALVYLELHRLHFVHRKLVELPHLADFNVLQIVDSMWQMLNIMNLISLYWWTKYLNLLIGTKMGEDMGLKPEDNRYCISFGANHDRDFSIILIDFH